MKEIPWGVYGNNDELIGAVYTNEEKKQLANLMVAKIEKLEQENKALKDEIERLKNKYENNLKPQIPLDAEVKPKVLELRKQGLTYRAIAKETGVSKSSVGKIIQEEGAKHIE